MFSFPGDQFQLSTIPQHTAATAMRVKEGTAITQPWVKYHGSSSACAAVPTAMNPMVPAHDLLAFHGSGPVNAPNAFPMMAAKPSPKHSSRLAPTCNPSRYTPAKQAIWYQGGNTHGCRILPPKHSTQGEQHAIVYGAIGDHASFASGRHQGNCRCSIGRRTQG